MLMPGMAPRAALAPDDAQLCRALRGVVANARRRALPLFARTLGLYRPQLTVLADRLLPELGELARMPEQHFELIAGTAPQQFFDLVELLFARRSPDAHLLHAYWLAHAICAASFGRRHLWQDLGLDGRAALEVLLSRYFEPFYLANAADLKWKRFLYLELGFAKGIADLQPPSCSACAQFSTCCATPSARSH